MANNSRKNTPGGATLAFWRMESLNMVPMVWTALGRPATMPAKISREMPLPTPRSVICSPSHITKILPVARVKAHMNLKPMPGFTTTSGPML